MDKESVKGLVRALTLRALRCGSVEAEDRRDPRPPEGRGSTHDAAKAEREGLEAAAAEAEKAIDLLPCGVAPSEGHVFLEVDAERCDLLERALNGLARALEEARDKGCISHKEFCDRSDYARGVLMLVYSCQEKLPKA